MNSTTSSPTARSALARPGQEPEPISDSADGLIVTDLVKTFGGNRVLDALSFSAKAGSTTGLIGPNGAGKSTAIDLVSGLLRADSGAITVFGQRVEHMAPHRVARLGIARTFQNFRLWDGLSVFENVLAAFQGTRRESVGAALFRRHRNTKTHRTNTEAALEVLSELELYGVRNELARSLSGGQKRLLELARVAVVQPRILLLDEPLAGVAPSLWDAICAITARFATGGAAVVMVEHHLEFVDNACDQIIVMADGKAIAAGSLVSLRESAAVVDAYLGTNLGSQRAE